MKIAIASDHAGFEVKQKIIEKYQSTNTFLDLGPSNEDRTDYPDHADKVAVHISKNAENNTSLQEIGILVCGSGQGMAMRANKYPQIRAALCWNGESAQLSRAHNDANVLCLGGRLLSFEVICKIIDSFLATPFEGGRHADRVKKMTSSLVK